MARTVAEGSCSHPCQWEPYEQVGCEAHECCEIRALEIQLPLRGRTATIPNLDRIIQTGRQELVIPRTHTQTRHPPRMSAEIPNEGVVVHAQISDSIVYFGAGVNDGGGVVGELGQGRAIFLALHFFGVRAGFGVVELDGVVAAGEEEEFPGIVEVDGGVFCA